MISIGIKKENNFFIIQTIIISNKSSIKKEYNLNITQTTTALNKSCIKVRMSGIDGIGYNQFFKKEYLSFTREHIFFHVILDQS